MTRNVLFKSSSFLKFSETFWLVGDVEGRRVADLAHHSSDLANRSLATAASKPLSLPSLQTSELHKTIVAGLRKAQSKDT